MVKKMGGGMRGRMLNLVSLNHQSISFNTCTASGMVMYKQVKTILVHLLSPFPPRKGRIDKARLLLPIPVL